MAEGDTEQQAADKAHRSKRTITRWKAIPEFEIEVNRLTFMIDVATRAGRLRIANKVVKGRIENTQYPQSRADLLDWLKFIQGETDGINLNLASLLEAATQVALEGPARVDTEIRHR